MHLGFIGTGRMGLPMVRRLIAAGHTITAYDASADALAHAEALGAKGAASPAEVAHSTETVLASLPTPNIVRAVALGPNGVIEGKTVRTFVDLSTTGSRAAREVASGLRAKTIVQLDAPVSGGVGGAEKGTLAVMVSGPRASFDPLADVLGVIGRTFFIGEESGLGQTMKLVNNILSANAMAASAEAMVVAAKAGIDPGIAIDVINAGTGRNTATVDKFPRAILPGTFDFGFATGLMLKDVRLFLTEAEALGVPVDIAQAVACAWTTTADEIGPEKDFTTVIQPLEARAGVKVRSRQP
ncbi:MAG: hypothetical protein QOD74_585 [Variibacter sp.]|nr:hypothetical protein [Variibacter sp.]